MSKEYYEAIVTDNKDPEHRLRIKVSCLQLVEEGEELPYWFEARPEIAGKAGFCLIPSVGDQVTIEIDVGEDGLAVTAIDPKWIACIVDNVPEEFIDHYPNVYGFWTPKGSVLIFDDTDDYEKISLVTHTSRVSIELDAAKERLKLTAPEIIFDTKFIHIGNPDNDGEFIRTITRYGKKVL